MKKFSVTVAIPAYNEEKNIEYILKSILSQKIQGITLKNIVVYSDGSTDKTTQISKNILKKNQIIKVIEGKIRRGKIYRLNQIFSNNKSDILIVLDADIKIKDRSFLRKICKEITNNPKANMIACHQIPLEPKNFSGKIIYATFKMWDYVRLSIPKFDHVQNFYGAATAYRKSFAKKLFIPEYLKDERIYIYLSAKKTDSFRYSLKSCIYYWPVTSIKDFLKLSKRPFGKKNEELKKLFGEKVNTLHIIPMRYKIAGILKSFYYQPLYTPFGIFFGILLNELTSNKFLNKILIKNSLSWGKNIKTKKNHKKKIIISSYDDLKNPVYAGGGAYSVHQLAKKLAKKNEVKVFTGTYKNDKNEIVDNVKYERIGSDILGHKIGQIIYQYALLKYAIKEKYDIWIESTTPPFTFSLLPLFCKNPVISWVNMLCSYDMQRKYKVNLRPVEQELSKLYKYTVVPTNWVKKEIAKMNSNALITTIAPGIEQPKLSKLSKEKPELKNYFLFIGRIEINQKGLDLLLKAAKLSRTSVQIVIAGEGSKKEERLLSDLISRYKISRKIKRIGRVREVKKEILLKNAKAVIIPSRFETFSLVALEAITHQKPIICFSIPPLSWIPPKYSVKITPFNTRQLAHHIDTLASWKASKKISATEKNNYLKKFSWTNTTRKFEEYISKINDR